MRLVTSDRPSRILGFIRPVAFLGRNVLTILGAALTTGAGLTMVGFWGLEILQLRPVQPYAGIVLFFGLPAVFVAGLVLMSLGVLIRRRSLRARGELPSVYPEVDLRYPAVRRALAIVAVATLANVVLLSAAAYQSTVYMDSTQFCGLTCHTVMAPEYTAYLVSPHSRVACTDCHIGPGASWFVRSKLSGVHQLFAVAFHTYPHPIPVPVRHLRPARETCERCHWPQMSHGDKLVVLTSHADDAANTPSTTVLSLKVGGRRWDGADGIHGRHLGTGVEISYVALDEQRQVIPLVTHRGPDGRTVEYRSTDAKLTAEKLAHGERRTMDCMDCHNRPTHTFELPERAVDEAIQDGSISSTLPFVRKESVTLLRAAYPDQQTAARRIRDGVDAFYRQQYPDVLKKDGALVERAAGRLVTIYKQNVFPAMRVTWGTYANNLGHTDFPGCFRCHDGSHKSSDGRTITQDCTACHGVLAMDEKNPKVLADLGLK